MERKNYFELLGLDFDPPERNDAKIRRAIADWKQRTENKLANETSAHRRAALKEELSLYEDIVSLMSDRTARMAEARALKKQRLDRLDQILDLMQSGCNGPLVLIPGQVGALWRGLGLSTMTMDAVLDKRKITVRVNQIGKCYREAILPLIVSSKLNGLMEQLRSTRDPEHGWLGDVKDLYELAWWYVDGTYEERGKGKTLSTQELQSVMRTGMIRYRSDISTFGHMMGDLFSTGAQQIFDSEDSRARYDNTLRKTRLEPLFEVMRSAPVEIRKDEHFAQGCIGKIRECFPDAALALAIYNTEAYLTQDPYEPAVAVTPASADWHTAAAE